MHVLQIVTKGVCLVVTLAATLAATAGAAEDAAAILAKSAAAFRANEPRQKNWNWQTVETRDLVDRSGKSTQSFPSLTSESVIRADGRRCNAVVAWGDGRKPYLADADPDERCQAMAAIGTPFPPSGVLLSQRAKLLSTAGGVVTLSVEPDKSKLKDPDYATRCGSSLRATITLDAATHFPLRIEGEVAESGCDGSITPVNQYQTAPRVPLTTLFRKGATFRVEWTLQKDKTGDPGKNFWIASTQHYSYPWDSDSRVVAYWGRQLAVTQDGHRLVKDVKTTAQEFVVGSELIFK